MAVNIRQLFPLQQAKERRGQLQRYLKLDGGRYLIGAALILSLMSLISLGQTGRLATQGYELAQLQVQRTQLMRDRSALQLRLSEAQSLEQITRRAKSLNMHPMTPDQVRYVTVEPTQSVPPTAVDGQATDDKVTR